MYDFGAFCYLDVQKTGSTFIERTLKEVSILPIALSSKHASVELFTIGHFYLFMRPKKLLKQRK